MKKILACSVFALAMSGAANATIITFTSDFGPATTNWTNTLSYGLFDSSLGTLNSVTFNYKGDVNTAIKFESLDADLATVTATAGAKLAFSGPVTDTLTITSFQDVDLTAYDGVTDYAGTSGVDLGVISTTKSGSQTLTSGLGAFLGTGTSTVGVKATGASGTTGAGNLDTTISTTAAAHLAVTYDYTPHRNVPEPASLALIGAGLVGLGLRKKKQA